MDAMNEDALSLILERVESHVSLVRAAAVCRRWRRAVADAAFLRRYRSLHAPPAAGYYHNPTAPWGVDGKLGYSPVFVPSSPPIVDVRHLSLDFLPGGAESWSVQDSRGSLLVLMDTRYHGRALPDLAICEPLTRSFHMIPPPPGSDCWGSILLDSEVNEVGGRISMSNFRLLCINGVTLTSTSIFTAGSSWSEMNIDPMAPGIGPDFRHPAILGRASGSWYFYIRDGSRTLIGLDGSTGVFSSSVLPAIENWDVHIQSFNCILTEGCDGNPRIVALFDGTMKVFSRLDSTEWALEKMIQLSEATCSLSGYPSSFVGHNISTIGVGFIILSQRVFGIAEQWPFSVNLETMEASPAANNVGRIAYQCELPWPPALHACLD
ncbi:unnamed protein product [Urochloa decumbens]|uniref:F-box domain-containing protein n=1 Tax=Urochloa decumbens TaxID=240449 RepID=A0ABC8VIM0_9POAL